jgi:dinuclear metal center YbgI/SA1388 family protein
MTKIQAVVSFLDAFAPTRLAEDWDNVGLLVGDADGEVTRIMTCLTVTPESAQEAIDQQADLIVSHHPLPFRPIKKLTTAETASRLIWNLARAGVSIYSPHTGFDSAQRGINQSLAEKLSLANIRPLNPIVDEPNSLGSGRVGECPARPIKQFVDQIKFQFQLDHVHLVAGGQSSINQVAVACGSGGSFLDQVIATGCDAFVTGEATFHTCLEAKANDVVMILLGHYTSERFAVEKLADHLSENFSGCEVWCSQQEVDPVQIY